MPNLNQVILVGNLTRDPSVKYLPSGTPVATISIAVNNRVKQGDTWKDDPTFIDIVAWDQAAEWCGEHLSKGAPVLVEGQLRQRRWETKAGEKRQTYEIKATRVQGLAPTKGGGTDEPAADDDDVPF